MKVFYSVLLVSLCLWSCSNKEVKNVKNSTNEVMEKPMVKSYPTAINNVFEAHGGMGKWNSFSTLTYKMGDSEPREKQTVDLKSRKIRIEKDKFNIGFDGTDVWVEALDTNTYKGDARFYHNLYFYFFAMPFVLGDDGTSYEETMSLTIDSVEYPGIKISYGNGVGDSPEDNYFLYYHPETKQATWLGYTVTYFEKKKSEEIHYLHFESWKEVNGVSLPNVLHWYTLDENKMNKKSRGKVSFSDIDLSTKVLPDSIFHNPNKS